MAGVSALRLTMLESVDPLKVKFPSSHVFGSNSLLSHMTCRQGRAEISTKSSS